MSNPYQPDPHGGYGQQPYPPQQPGYGYPQQPPQPGYGYPQAPVPPMYPVAPPNNNAATTSVVIGFITVLLSCFYLGLLGLVGLGFGIAGLNRSAATGVGRNTAIGGIVLNTLAVLISIAIIVLAVSNYSS
ncbi:hypothetical protein ACIQBJ_23670 [Kitasatospora sp. NPDC088391]|uniref:hypothetical protein n=1 Tax=Kitasatospora sp. NPDC088391 TaxID=3364074 RepID=UPI0037F918AB